MANFVSACRLEAGEFGRLFVLLLSMVNLVSARRLGVSGVSRSASQGLSVEMGRSRVNNTAGIPGRRRDSHIMSGHIDVGPLFNMWSLTDKGDNVYLRGDHEYKCCCDYRETDGKCRIADMKEKNWCDGTTFSAVFRDRDGCGCLVDRVGWRSFQKLDTGVSKEVKMCRLSVEEAVAIFEFDNDTELKQEVETASKTRMMSENEEDSWSATYGECSKDCGHGVRQFLQLRPTSQGEDAWNAPAPLFPPEIDCVEMRHCDYACDMPKGCGWGSVHCQDGKPFESSLCKVRELIDEDFPTPVEHRLDHCFETCETQHERIQSMCAVTANHLDEQYYSLATLADRTCRESKNGTRTNPDLIIIMAQELNHANKLSDDDDKNDFHKYVNPTSLPGYIYAGDCAPQQSANTAIYIRKGLEQHIFSASEDGFVECSDVELRSTCDWTNCKGNTVLGAYTSNGMLVVGNWHGARGPMLSEQRIKEFDDAANYILGMQSWLGKKHVVWGGDTNVRSSFPRTFKLDSHDVGVEFTPSEIRESVGVDVLGRLGVPVDDHLTGKFALSSAVALGLKNNPLYQARDWDKLCPTYRKTDKASRMEKKKIWTGDYRKDWFGEHVKNMETVTREYPNLACRTPEDQLASPVMTTEYTDFSRVRGKKTRAPSWTERIFLSEDLYRNCGKLMKDIRNEQSDHDPVFVKCTMPV